ncbi:MAG: glycosyltransferase family 4 protein [Gemmatimonadota bacterium]|nr:glycosyltransferase family 4 protein [Gemmatimonadota bacterium]
MSENSSVPSDRRVWQEACALRTVGYKVTVVCPQGRHADFLPYERIEDIDLHRFALRPADGGVGYLREYSTAFARISRLVSRLGRHARFDVVHACNPPDLLFVAALPLRRKGAAFIFDHHDLVPELYLSRFGRRDPLYATALLCERLTFALADVVLCTNESYRQVAFDRGHKAPSDVFVVRNAPDLTKFTRVEPDPDLKAERPFLLAYVGLISEQDGVGQALHALSSLRRRRTDWRAVFVGDGDALSDVRDLADKLELGNMIEFLGWRGDHDVIRVLSTADVCLSPEPSSPINDVSTLIKVGEYMAMSCPIVACDLPESRFTAGEAAVFVPSNDSEAFAARIDELLDDPQRRAAMGEFGRRRMEHELSWKLSERALFAAYDRALEKRSSGCEHRPTRIQAI